MNCNVLSMDLSLTSLSYAIRKTRELGITNIEYMQGDILKIDQLGRLFDIIESVGILHHMDDPLTGWKVLVDRLRSGGLMKAGLYNNLARQYIVKAHKHVAKKDIQPLQMALVNFVTRSLTWILIPIQKSRRL